MTEGASETDAEPAPYPPTSVIDQRFMHRRGRPPPVTDVPAAITGPKRARRHAAASDEALARSTIALYAGRMVNLPRVTLVYYSACRLIARGAHPRERS